MSAGFWGLACCRCQVNMESCSSSTLAPGGISCATLREGYEHVKKELEDAELDVLNRINEAFPQQYSCLKSTSIPDWGVLCILKSHCVALHFTAQEINTALKVGRQCEQVVRCLWNNASTFNRSMFFHLQGWSFERWYCPDSSAFDWRISWNYSSYLHMKRSLAVCLVTVIFRA